MKINLDSPVIVFLTTVADFMIFCSFYAVRRSLRSARQSVPFTRLLCARQDMRVDIYSNLFSKHLKIISSRRFSYPSCI